MLLENKVAVVTGSSQGIGKAIAVAFAKAGANLVINYYPGMEESANTVVEEIKEIGRQAIALPADVSKNEDVEKLIADSIAHFGRIDILVNNAGITRDTLLMRMKEEDWDAVLNTNLKGVFLCTKAVARPMMKQKSGKIINIASVIGQMGNIGQANYAAAKAGVIGFTKSSARELAPKGVNVNAIAPGFIRTKMTDVLTEDVKAAMLKQIPMGKLGEADDVANMAIFLASSLSDYVTGHTLNVDGGMVMQ